MFALAWSLASCAIVRTSPKYQLGDDVYVLKQKGMPPQKVYVDAQPDTVLAFRPDDAETRTTPLPRSGLDEYFIKNSFDVDLTLIPFKYRPSQAGFPRQLNTEFCGSVFVGYRRDRFQVRFRKTPAGVRRETIHRAAAIGVFGGVSSVFVSPWTTNYLTTDEYSGFAFTRGIAIQAGVNALTVGVGLGFDYLTDRDKSIWIYQNKPWVGLTLGINLN